MIVIQRTAIALAAGGLVFMLQACSSSPVLDSRFGESVNLAKAQQTASPDASRNRNMVAGIDGKAAHEYMVRYRASFRAPPPPANVFTIGVSGGSQ